MSKRHGLNMIPLNSYTSDLYIGIVVASVRHLML